MGPLQRPKSNIRRPTSKVQRIGVLGTLVWDTIRHPADGELSPVEQWGGIAYSLCAISAAAPVGWSIVPLVRVGDDLAGAADELFRSLPNVDPTRGVRVVPEPNNRVELQYLEERAGAPARVHDRTETLTGGVSPWPTDELLPLIDDLDALFINFISGFELALETAEAVGKSDIPIYADLHSLFLGPTSERPRRPRPLPEWERWARAFDAVQVNDAELALIRGSAESDGGDPLVEMVRGGCALAVETRGASGARFAAASDRLHPRVWPGARGARLGSDGVTSGIVAPPGGARAGDPTGCGDVWGAVLFAGLLEGLALEAAVERAHEAAAAKLGTRRIGDLPAAIARSVRERAPR